MSEEVTLLLIEMIKAQKEEIDKINKKVDELLELKNKLIAAGVVLSAIFGFIWDWCKNFFGKS